MIIDEKTHPEEQIYYVGALALEVLQELEEENILLLELFVELKKRHNHLSINLITLSLDWLYLLEGTTFSHGKVWKCF